MPTGKKKENPQAFKHWFNKKLLHKYSQSIKKVYPQFNSTRFLKNSMKLESLEMKPRVRLIRDALIAGLPEDYLMALKILTQSVEIGDLKGFALWPYTEFVQMQGLHHVDESLKALHFLTQRFTAEFAIRPFIVKHPKQTSATLNKWALDKNEHVRRLASEGSRPRLPWGVKLNASISNPEYGLKILEKIKFDDSLYVRKSVANHLNDITKDHPDLVIKTLRGWRKKASSKDRDKIDWIAKQALRTLVKSGYTKALVFLGFDKSPEVIVKKISLNKTVFEENDTLTFEFDITSSARKTQSLVIDYIIYYQKSGGKLSPKVFKLKNIKLKPNETIKITKNHFLRQVTTRRHYAGLHKVEIQINGIVYISRNWMLKL